MTTVAAVGTGRTRTSTANTIEITAAPATTGAATLLATAKALSLATAAGAWIPSRPSRRRVPFQPRSAVITDRQATISSRTAIVTVKAAGALDTTRW